jgi:hypothetical protein
MRHSKVIGIFFVLLFFLLIPFQALAQSFPLSPQNQPIFVPDNSTVRNVFVWGSDARIAGTVGEMILVVNGDIYLEPTANVELVVDLGGRVFDSSLESGRKEIYQLTLNGQWANQLLLAGTLTLGLWIIRLGLSFFSIFLLTLSAYLLRNRFQYARELLKNNGSRVVGIGMILTLGILAISIIVMLTIYGIPLSLVLLVLTAIFSLIGVIPIMDYLGRVLSPKFQEYPPLTIFFAQAVLLVAFANLPLIGPIFMFVIGSTGLALNLASIRNMRKNRTQ